MPNSLPLAKGGSNAAFFLLLFAVAVLGLGGSVQYPLAVLRTGAFGSAVLFFWGRRKEPIRPEAYAILVGSFVVVSIGHSFSSTYFWVSFQHAVNIALAALLMTWALLLFRKSPDRMWDATCAAVGALAVVEIGIALFQRFHGGELRPQGTLDNANYLAEFLVAASLLLLSRLLWDAGSRPLRPLKGVAVILFLAAAFFLGGSRGVLIGSVPAVGLLLMIRYGVRKGVALFAGVGVPALVLLGFRAAGRFFGTDVHNYSRWIIWKSALRTFFDHPFGVGLGGFKYYWFTTQSPVDGAFSRFGRHATTAHNEYLEVLSGLGAIGFVLFLAVLAVPPILAIQRRNEIAPERRPQAAGAASVLLLSGIHALFNCNFHVFGIFVLDALMLGSLLSCLPVQRIRIFELPAWVRVAAIVGWTALMVATISTAAGIWFFDRGERLLREGDLSAAERAFHRAVVADPFRAPYPDAISAIGYRRYAAERNALAPLSPSAVALLDESVRWEGRAASLNPREPKYLQRLFFLFTERFRAVGSREDRKSAMTLASRWLEIQPYSAEALLERSTLHVSTGNFSAAIGDLEEAVAFEPNFCRGYAKLAEMSGRTDPSMSAGWADKADACRKQAAGIALEEYETWMVEGPGK